MVKEKAKPKHEVTKRRLSRWQRERKRQRIILGSGIFIITVVLGIVGAGWYINQYRPLHQTVIMVNDTKFDMNYYIKMLKYYGEGQPGQYMYALANEVVKVIEQNELIRQGAEEVGISVNNKVVDKELSSRSPPLSKDYRDMVRTEIIVNKLLDEYFEQQVPVFAEQRYIMVMLLESESQATEVSARLEGGDDFGDLAGELSLDEFTKDRKGDLGWRPKDVLAELLATSIPGEYVFSADVGALSQPIYDETKIKGVGYWVVEVLEREQETEQAHVRAILLASEEEAWQVRNRLETGEDFTALAKELSQHGESKEDGGDLGWLAPGETGAALDELVFGSEVEGLSEPIRDEAAITEGGYWLLKVLDKDDNKKIEKSSRDLLKAKALNEWGSSLWDDPKYEIDDSYLDDEKKLWAVEKAIRS